MPLIQSDQLPAHSTLWQHHNKGDFLDCYSCGSDLPPQRAVELALTMPGWAEALMKLRNTLVKPLGLKTEIGDRDAGDAIFPITHESSEELILGTDDSHLDFRIAVLQHRGRVYMSTWVHPHNLLGKAYLHVIMPFHVLIVRSSITRVAEASLKAA
ncbi:MAG: DUF2867 domain-containing protein [Pseudomonadota bacterium]|nr:DUF2867 domain-containing protein [Pseudomonadota bacterium]MEC8041168.1 DUF2867 domain-containing protein [Pseudomonadota bacterium]